MKLNILTMQVLSLSEINLPVADMLVVKKLTDGLSAMAKMRKVTVVQGVGKFMMPIL